jgi:pimeloyl-ACP methyl ester carboxylesterase
MTQYVQVSHNGAQFAVESSGEGLTLVFLHAGVADRRMWADQTAALSSRWRTVAYDRRGFGETACGEKSFSHVEDLAAVLDGCGVESAALIGCSQGGRIAIDFTLAHPQRISALVLIAPAISGAPEPGAFPPDIEQKLAALEAAETADDIDRVNAIEANLWLDGPAMPPGRVTGKARELLLAMNGLALRHPELTGEIEPPSAWERLSELSLPALVIWGALDFPHIQRNCRHLVETLPRARGMELDGVAHLPGLEQPARLNKVLAGFVSEEAR